MSLIGSFDGTISQRLTHFEIDLRSIAGHTGVPSRRDNPIGHGWKGAPEVVALCSIGNGTSPLQGRVLLLAIAVHPSRFTSLDASANTTDDADEMFFYREDGLCRFYDVKPNGSLGSPILAGMVIRRARRIQVSIPTIVECGLSGRVVGRLRPQVKSA